MTRQRDIERVLDGFLADGTNELADHVLDAALLDIDKTKQRRSWWPAWRFARMNVYAKLAIAAAAVLVVLVAGYQILPRTDQPGASPTLSPTPAATPSPTPEAIQELAEGPLRAGPVVAHVGPSGSIDATFTVPPGWRGFDDTCAGPVAGSEAPVGFCFLGADGLHSDPCHPSSENGDIPVGPTVEDLANALDLQTAYEATTPVDATLDGYSGKLVDLHFPTDLSACDGGRFFPWSGAISAQGADQLWHVYILDVAGERVIIAPGDYAETPTEERAEQQAIIDSIQFTP